MKTTLEERAKRYAMFIDNDSDYTKNAIKEGIILKDTSLVATKNLSNMKEYVDKVSYTYSHALGQTVGTQLTYMADDVDRELRKINKRIDKYHGDISFTVKDKEIKVRKDVALIAAASGISVLVSLVLNKLISRRCS